MRSILRVALVAALFFGSAYAEAAVLTIKDGTATSRNFFYFQDGSSNYFPAVGIYGLTGDAQADVNASDNGLDVHVQNPLNVVNPAVASLGSPFPSSPAGVGVAGAAGNITPLIQAGGSVPIDISTATTTQLIPLVAGKAIYITAWDVISAGTGAIQLEYGTGLNCVTGTTMLTGNYSLIAQTGIAKGNGLGPVLIVPIANALCAVTSTTAEMSGSVSFGQW